MVFKELQEIQEILRNFKNLGASYLMEDEKAFARKTDEIVKEIEEKLRFIDLIDEKIEELEAEIAEKDVNEIIDIEMIRSKTQMKKAEKQLRKLESLNSSRIKVDINERDKVRMRKNHAKLKLVKRLLDMTLHSDGKVLLAENHGSFKVFQINKNNSKEVNSEILWTKMKDSSPYIKEWEALFEMS